MQYYLLLTVNYIARSPNTMEGYCWCAMSLIRCYATARIEPTWKDGGHHLPRQPPVLLWCPFKSPWSLLSLSTVDQGWGDCMTVVPGILCPLCKKKSHL